MGEKNLFLGSLIEIMQRKIVNNVAPASEERTGNVSLPLCRSIKAEEE